MTVSPSPRLLVPLAAILLLAACGSTATPAARASQSSSPAAKASATPAEAASASSAPASTPTAAPAITAAPAPPAPPALIAVATVANNVDTIRLLGVDGSTVASTSVPYTGAAGIDGWVKSGPDGAYWLSGGILHRLGRNGSVTDVATLPKGSLFAVGPNGEIAYASQIDQSADGSTWTNQLSLIANGTTQVLADRSSAGSPTSAAAAQTGIPPYPWNYDPIGWTDAGIVIARIPASGCGCGSFGMDSVQGYSAVVDPTTAIAGSVMDDPSCPLSGIAADGLTACFHTPEVRTSKNEGLGADAINLLTNGAVTQTFSMSTQNSAGDAAFSADATQLAYGTAPAGLDCGSWEGKSQMRVLNLVTGTAGPVGPLGLMPVAWLPDGWILASDTTVSTNQADPYLTGAVIVDPATGALTTLPLTTTDATTVLGVVTG